MPHFEIFIVSTLIMAASAFLIIMRAAVVERASKNRDKELLAFKKEQFNVELQIKASFDTME